MALKRRSNFERIIIVGVVLLSVFMAIGLYKKRTEARSTRQLMQELFTLRSAITLYYTMNHVFPPNLEDLFKKDYDFGDGIKRRFIEKLPLREDGVISDPFGNPYQYISSSGWVKSQTKGYETW